MKRYKVFISYRKTASVNADYVKNSIVNDSPYTKEDVFLDKHEIGPEQFDQRIKLAIEKSGCLVLLVTKDCFKPKVDDEDWFIEEIRVALKNKICIIPLFFDGIKTLSSNKIKKELEKSFSPSEIDKLIKTQGVSFSTEYSEASIEKLISFIINANRSILSQIRIYATLLIVFAILFTLLFSLFFGVGALWGYYSSKPDVETLMADYTTIDDHKVKFSIEGYSAIYDLDNDTITEVNNINGMAYHMNNKDLIVSSLSIPGARLLLEKNFSNLKYLKYFKGGSKQAKIGVACAYAVAFAGVLLGFSQGSYFGKTKKQEESIMLLLPIIREKKTWKPAIKKDNNLIDRYIEWEVMVKPSNKLLSIAYLSGLTSTYILLRYNEWEIGVNNYNELLSVLENSKDQEKKLLCLDLEDLLIKQFSLPSGIVGVSFSRGPGSQKAYDMAISLYNQWSECE